MVWLRWQWSVSYTHLVVRCRQEGREYEVGRACGEAEACAEADIVGDDGENAIQSSINNIQREAQEHEAELKRLGNAADECTDGSGQDQTDSSLLVLRSLDHSQSRTGNTEHHAGEEAGHIHAEAPGNAVLTGNVAGPVVRQVAQADGIEPEYVVECVVQTGRNQQTVKECIDAGDVYKRQVLYLCGTTLKQLLYLSVHIALRRDASGSNILTAARQLFADFRFAHIIPVSYTHLDVYKRQG